MTDESQRIAIAESLGLEWKHSIAAPHSDYILLKHKTWWLRYDPLTDLNACHEMEKGLTDDQTGAYRYNLMMATGRAHVGYVSATARQRCEAYLKTLGLWRDEG